MKQIKDCKHREKNGRCKKLGHNCSNLPMSALSVCPEAVNHEKPVKKGRKKR